MKKLSNIFICGLLMVASLSGCTTQKNIVDYYLNDNGNLIGKYEDGSTIDLGDFNPDAVGAVNEVTISDDGYYVINGIKTEIKAKQVSGYHLDDKGHLIVEYSDGTTEDLGEFDEDISGEVETITISDDGYYVINGTKTNIVAKQSYTVKFNTGCSIKVEDQKVLEGHKIIKPEINRDGYTLNGWYCNDEDWRFNSDIVLNDMTLEAKWSANTYTITFDSNGGSAFDSIKIKTGENYQLPTPTKDLYDFAGWYFNESLIQNSGVFNFAKNLTLKAKWERTTYTITFDSNGGDYVAPINVPSYSTIESLPIPTRKDHKFLGWYNGESKVELPYEFKEGNLSLKAKWQGMNDFFEFSVKENEVIINKYLLDETTLNIPDTIADKKVTTISTGAIIGKKNLTEINFGNNLLNFEFKCIQDCNNLKALSISGNAKAELVYIFGSNELVPNSLEKISFNKNSTTYGDWIFNGIKNKTFSVHVETTIDGPEDAFYDCEAINSIFFPEGMKKFNNRVVCGCTNCTYVKVPSTLESVGMNNFMNSSILYVIYPEALKYSDYGGLCANGAVILVEAETRPQGWSRSAFTIHEEEYPIFYGFQKLVDTDDFLYALCQSGLTKKCVIIQRYTTAAYPETLEGYPVFYNNDSYTNSNKPIIQK